MKIYHLIAGLLVIVLFLTSLLGGMVYAQTTEDGYVHALAPEMFDLKYQGSALQKAAFHQSDLLVIYGSSELDIKDPYRCIELFNTYPTGFMVFPIGKAGTENLIVLQDLAAIGPDLRGKKVVISETPTWFLSAMEPVDYYQGNFSLLHANALAFSTDLSFSTKQAAARRMLKYPKTIAQDPLLKFTLERLTDGSLWSRAIYYTLLPLGKLRTWVIQAQDQWDTHNSIHQKIQAKPPLNLQLTKQPATLDWPGLLTKASQVASRQAQSNPFGFNDWSWQHTYNSTLPQKNSMNDAQFLKNLQQSAQWQEP